MALSAIGSQQVRAQQTQVDDILRQIDGLSPQLRREADRALRSLERSSSRSPLEVPEDPLDPQLVPGEPLELPEVEEEEEEDEVERFKGGDLVAVRFSFGEDFEPDEEQEEFLELLQSKNPYRLDIQGNIRFPRMRPIDLSGLGVGQALVRLESEPDFRPFQIELFEIRPVRAEGEEIELFGYDVFDQGILNFIPTADGTVLTGYTIGPGDWINLQLFGSRDEEYLLEVSPAGTLMVPSVGAVQVAGLTFNQLRDELVLRLKAKILGVDVSVTMAEYRSVRVFVLGEVNRPGSYVLSGLSTMTHALFMSEGIQTTGSLRGVQLKRRGETVATLDLYDLLLRGDTSADARLESGDAVFVPPIGDAIALSGGVRRPAIYEMPASATLEDLVATAGGFVAKANQGEIRIERVESGTGVTAVNIDFGVDREHVLQDGDFVTVPLNRDRIQEAVSLQGHVHHPGIYAWAPEMRLTDLLPSAEHLQPNADSRYVLIRREVEPNIRIAVLSADLEQAWAAPQGADNVALQDRDTVQVVEHRTDKRHVVSELIEELEAQSRSSEEIPVVAVEGAVRDPGPYPLEDGMRVSDLLRAGGGLSESADGTFAELSRRFINEVGHQDLVNIRVDLPEVLRGEAESDLVLNPRDQVIVRTVPRWSEAETVEVRGEVEYPGLYAITRGETLSELLLRCGGLTDDAFVNGAIFLREELRMQEAEQLEYLASRIERDVLSNSVADGISEAEVATGELLVEQLRSSEALGRLVIDLESIIEGDSEEDIVLRAGDELLIPPVSQVVSVFGEVQRPSSHLHQSLLTRDDYIERSGGLTATADKRRIYVVRASGEVVLRHSRRGLFSAFRSVEPVAVSRGDTIVVPIHFRFRSKLELWSTAAQLAYQMAIGTRIIAAF